MCGPSVARLTVSVVVVSLFACSTADITLPRPLTADQLVGDYNLTSIAWRADEPFRPLPTWTWPGRVLVLDGSLHLSRDGHFVASAHSRTTLFGDTTFSESSGSGFWTLSGDTIWLQPSDLRNSPGPARFVSKVLTTYAGGFESGGTRVRYSKLGGS